MIQKLKPDLNTEELIAKRVNAERIKEFSKQLQDFNKKSIQVQKKLPSSSEVNSIEIEKMKLESKRIKALEFAKNIPKPKADKPLVLIKGSNSTRALEEDDSYLMKNNDFGGDYRDISKIESLEIKHEESRRQVEAIKRSMGLMK